MPRLRALVETFTPGLQIVQFRFSIALEHHADALSITVLSPGVHPPNSVQKSRTSAGSVHRRY